MTAPSLILRMGAGMMTEEQAREILRSHVACAESQAEWARHHGISRHLLNDCLAHRLPIPKQIARVIGLQRVRAYEYLPDCPTSVTADGGAE